MPLIIPGDHQLAVKLPTGTVMPEVSEARPASTVVLLRDTSAGMETLLRSGQLARACTANRDEAFMLWK